MIGHGQDLRAGRPVSAPVPAQHVDRRAAAHPLGMQLRDEIRRRDDGRMIESDDHIPLIF